MAKLVFVLTGLLVVLMAAGRAGIHADASLDGPVIPMPLAEATGPHPDLVTKTQTPTDSTAPNAPTAKRTETVSTIEIPSTAFRVVYLFQYDGNPTKPGAAPTKDKPLSVVLWKALDIGTKVSPHDVRERIAENSASPSMTGKAVYTLQPDYKIQKLALSTQDIDHLFELLQAAKGAAIAADPTWKSKVASHLKEVEWLEDGRHKNKNKNKHGKDKAGKDRSAKTDKGAKSGKTTKSAADSSSKGHKKSAKA